MHHLCDFALAKLAIGLILGVLATPALFAQALIISIQPQPDAPIQIQLDTVISNDPYSPAFEYSLLNRSDKAIQAYTLSIKDGLSGFRFSLLESALQPMQSQRDIYRDITSSTPIKDIDLSVDWVEFVDRSTWGPDTTRSADQVAGMRVGMSAVREQLLKLQETDGVQSVVTALINNEELRVASQHTSKQQNQSDHWQRGFRTGVQHYRRRLSRVYEQQGSSGVKAALQQAVDQ